MLVLEFSLFAVPFNSNPLIVSSNSFCPKTFTKFFPNTFESNSVILALNVCSIFFSLYVFSKASYNFSFGDNVFIKAFVTSPIVFLSITTYFIYNPAKQTITNNTNIPNIFNPVFCFFAVIVCFTSNSSFLALLSITAFSSFSIFTFTSSFTFLGSFACTFSFLFVLFFSTFF